LGLEEDAWAKARDGHDTQCATNGPARGTPAEPLLLALLTVLTLLSASRQWLEDLDILDFSTTATLKAARPEVCVLLGTFFPILQSWIGIIKSVNTYTWCVLNRLGISVICIYVT
jgi:hypothetical protein